LRIVKPYQRDYRDSDCDIFVVPQGKALELLRFPSFGMFGPDSIDRERWEQIATKQCAVLSQRTFQGLFRFEVEYLRQKIMDNRYEFWIPDSEATNEIQITYTDKGQYCKHIIRKLFLSDFRCCGLGLFVNAFRWHVWKSEDTDTGHVKERLAPKQGKERGGDP
jgi:hypothetical protein